MPARHKEDWSVNNRPAEDETSPNRPLTRSREACWNLEPLRSQAHDLTHTNHPDSDNGQRRENRY
jgi:hypothetical protein